MSRKPYDELPWWCQLVWPWFGPPRCEQTEDRDAYLAAYWCAVHLSAAELAELPAIATDNATTDSIVFPFTVAWDGVEKAKL
jgi:hypothetical protein